MSPFKWTSLHINKSTLGPPYRKCPKKCWLHVWAHSRRESIPSRLRSPVCRVTAPLSLQRCHLQGQFTPCLERLPPPRATAQLLEAAGLGASNPRVQSRPLGRFLCGVFGKVRDPRSRSAAMLDPVQSMNLTCRVFLCSINLSVTFGLIKHN